jgi:hypothetical protein
MVLAILVSAARMFSDVVRTSYDLNLSADMTFLATDMAFLAADMAFLAADMAFLAVDMASLVRRSYSLSISEALNLALLSHRLFPLPFMPSVMRDIPDRRVGPIRSGPSLMRALPKPRDIYSSLELPEVQEALLKDLPAFFQLRVTSATIPRLRSYAMVSAQKLMCDFPQLNRDLFWQPKEYLLVLVVRFIICTHVLC